MPHQGPGHRAGHHPQPGPPAASAAGPGSPASGHAPETGARRDDTGRRPSSSSGAKNGGRWALLGGALALALVSAAAGFGGGTWFAGRDGSASQQAAPAPTEDGPGADASNPTEAAPAETERTGPDFFGDRPTDTSALAGQDISRGGLVWTVSRLEHVSWNDTDPDNLCASLTIRNEADKTLHLTSQDFVVYSPDGKEQPVGYGELEGTEPLLAGDIDPGAEEEYSMCFFSSEDPEPGQWLVIYIGGAYAGERLVWINNR